MKKSLISILIIALVCSLSVVAFAATLSDVKGHWAKSSIDRWTDEKIIMGYGDNTFKPDNNITRAEFVTFLMRIFEPSKVADLKSFSDMNRSAWYYEIIAKAVGMNAVEGYPATTIKPEANITRQEAMVILNRIIGLKPSKEATLDKFSDGNTVASWAKEALLAFEERGFIIGYEDGSLRPEREITRAETAKFLDRVFSAIITEAGKYDLSGENGVVVVKEKNVTLENTDDVARIFALNNSIRDTLKPVVKDIDIINPDEKKTTGGSSGHHNTTAATEFTITLTSSGDIYDITTSGKLSSKVNVTVIVDEKTVVDGKELSKSTFDSLKAEMITLLKSCLKDGTVDATMLTKTANDTYAGRADVVALGKTFRAKITGEAEIALTTQMINDWKAGKSMQDIYNDLTKADKITLGSILTQVDYETAYAAIEKL